MTITKKWILEEISRIIYIPTKESDLNQSIIQIMSNLHRLYKNISNNKVIDND